MVDLEPSHHSTVPVSATDTSPAHWIRPAAVLPLLERIERLPRGATGALLVGAAPNNRGAVLVENGRICWAVATDMRRRLVELLRHQTDPPLDTASLEAVYLDCRATNKPLGERLVESALITERGLRRALRQHNAEAIAMLSAPPGPPTELDFREHKKHRYDARFTFSSAEMLVTLGALGAQTSATLARMELKRSCPEGGTAAAYTRDRSGSGIVAVGALGAEETSCEVLLDMGGWATSTLDVASAVTSELKAVTGSTRSGRSIVAWSKNEVVFLVVCPTMSSYARLLSSLTRREQA